VRIEQNINYLDSINIRLDSNVRERIESDIIIERLMATRLDGMQRTLVRQVCSGEAACGRTTPASQSPRLAQRSAITVITPRSGRFSRRN
jgi:hypothetical protein